MVAWIWSSMEWPWACSCLQDTRIWSLQWISVLLFNALFISLFHSFIPQNWVMLIKEKPMIRRMDGDTNQMVLKKKNFFFLRTILGDPRNEHKWYHMHFVLYLFSHFVIGPVCPYVNCKKLESILKSLFYFHPIFLWSPFYPVLWKNPFSQGCF